MTSLERILSAHGPLARALGSAFEPRPEQARMAVAAAAAMEHRSHLLVEAGTGVGKSFAYLVPAMLRCLGTKEVVVVATNTIALQEQLVKRDIPMLLATLHKDSASPPPQEAAWSGSIRPVLVKGRGNYLSIRRLQMASKRQERLFIDPAQLRSLHSIEEWAYGTNDGTLATLPQLERPEVWDHAQSDADNCMGRKCPQYRNCFYQNARREAETANLLVCNHALFFSDLALRTRGMSILPRYDHVILDEAHHAEEEAAARLGFALTEGRVAHLLRTLHDPRRGKGALEPMRLAARDPEPVDRAIALVAAASSAADEFFNGWAGVILSGKAPTGRIREKGMVENTLTPAMRDLALRLNALKEGTQEEDAFELNAYARRADEIAASAAAFVDQSLEGCVYWVEQQESAWRRGRIRIELACSPVDVAPVLKEHLFGRQLGVILTSATLAAPATTRRGRSGGVAPDNPFAHAAERLGCEGATGLMLGSPFEFARQVRLYIDTTMQRPGSARGGRAPKAHGEARADAAVYHRELAGRILRHIDESDGGAFVLCTSFATIRALTDLLAGPLAQSDRPLLVQGRDGPRTELLERFRADERSVLLGAASFWQGVDVRGRALRNVIITKLPFDPPDRPLTEARGELISARGGDPFMDDALPRAVIRFKQGFGRLIRSRTDSGRVVVLDPRIATASYGKCFLDALPAGVPVVSCSSHGDECRTYTEHF